MKDLSAFNRNELLEGLKSTEYDLLVIGGGITGAGIALDAASRGLKTALIEKEDFASGTSSRSTKLIHGGLRYLKQFEIALVREVGRERAIVHKLAPHLVTSEKMLLPLIKDGTFGKFMTSVGLMVYDVLAGVESADQRKMLSKEKTLTKEPLLDEERLEGSGIYAEYRTDDARLTIEVIKTAAKYGAQSANYATATEFIYDANNNNQVCGAKVKDELTGEEFAVKAKYVVSATGPWVDELRGKDDSLEGKRLHLTKGVHLVVPHDKLPIKQAIYFDVPDGRMIFAIPRGKVTYIGTTDTSYYGDKNHIVTNTEDAEYLLKAVNDFFPTIHLTEDDVVSSWAGVRPLIHEEGKSESELSRKDEIFESETGLLSIAGGKLTGYRKMAERIVDLVGKRIRKEEDRNIKDCFTNKIPLTDSGFDGEKDVKAYRKGLSKQFESYGLEKGDVRYLVANYGKQCDIIFDYFKSIEEQDVRLRMLKAECKFCVEHELTHTLEDFYSRRTGRLYFDIESAEKYFKEIADVMKGYFNWTEERLQKEIKEMGQAIHEASNFEPDVQS